MKTTLLFSTGLACVLLAVRTLAAPNVVADWNAELAAAQQVSSQNTGGRVRADAIMRTVLDATRNGIKADAETGRTAESAPAGANLVAAAAQAAYSAMTVLYPESLPALDDQLAQSLAGVEDSAPAIAAGRKWGEHVAQVVLAAEDMAVYLNPFTFAEAVRAPVSPPPAPAVQAAQAPIGPGRYRFNVLAGASGTKGYVDGMGSVARFDNPSGIAVDGAGNVYVSERDLGTIRKISPDGSVTTLAGSAGQLGSQDGMGSAARFNQPLGVAADGTGNVYVADYGNHTIRKIDPSGNVTTLAGTAGAAGRIDGTKAMARLYSPAYIAVDDAGEVFFDEASPAASRGIVIRKAAPDGTVSSLTLSSQDANAWPAQLCADHAGILYVIYSDAWDFSDVWKLTPTAGGQYAASKLTSPLPFGYATELGADGANNLYVRYDSVSICRITPAGQAEVRYVGGNSIGYSLGAMTVDRSGTIFALSAGVSTTERGTIVIGVFDPAAGGPVIVQQPRLISDTGSGDYGEAFSGGTANLSVQAIGGPDLTYQWCLNSNPISGATGASLDLSHLQGGNAGFYSVIATDSGGSVTSRSAQLVVKDRTTSSGSGTGTGTTTSSSGNGSTGPGNTTAGSGSFNPGISLAALMLLAAASSRHRASRAGSAPGHGGRGRSSCAPSSASLPPDAVSPGANPDSRGSRAFTIAARETPGIKERT